MKKMMSMILVLVAILSMSGIASAEVFVEAITVESMAPAHEVAYEEPVYEEVKEAPIASSAQVMMPSKSLVPTMVVEEVIPMPKAEVFEDEMVPLGSGLGLVVEIVAESAPVYGEELTLKSFVVNPTGASLSYKWQYDNGMGWTTIENANESNFTFNYNELVSGYEFRVVVDYAAA